MFSRAKNYIIHTLEEIDRIRLAAQATARVREKLRTLCQAGMSTRELDDLAGALIAEEGGKSAFFGYRGYPGQICISVNEEVVHGIGRPDRILQPSDVVSMDLGVELNGACGDTAITITLQEQVPADIVRLLKTTEEALMAGIARARAGNFIRDISAAIEAVGRRARLGVVREYVGHGCGIHLHEPPEVPNFVTPDRGPRLQPGMVLAVEPMFNLGSYRVVTDAVDHWTVRTRDRSCSAHFEHMILITNNEPEILTWPKTM